VVTWTWVNEAREGQPFDRPFAWALVRLDGADTPMLHALDVASPDDMSVGQRVRVVWAEDRTGAIGDFHFAPDPDPGTDDESEASS
ncbi:MAG: OB-fold domain-containing protein, partial [Candidatus Microthrix parvicella]|nr:OB-fold domain-containing protein [Candidatus Microthrix parvicella]